MNDHQNGGDLQGLSEREQLRRRALLKFFAGSPDPADVLAGRLLESGAISWDVCADGPDAAISTRGGAGFGERIEVFSHASITAAQNRMAVAELDRRRVFAKAIGQMKNEEGRRIGVGAPPADRIKALARDFPTFSEVIDMVAARSVTSAKAAELAGADRAFKLPNILLVGKPGMGKTHFLRKLAEVLGAGHHLIQMGAASAGFVISGMDSGWASAKPGKIFEVLAQGEHANPIVVLDELDKVSQRSEHPVNGPLFALLERGSSGDWCDEFVAAPMDASHINYVATANDADALDAAILSRFEVFEIPDPDRCEAERIARSVYRDVLAREGWEMLFDPELPPDVLDRLAACTPREAHFLLGRALPMACADGRRQLCPGDFKAPKSTKPRAGFF